MNRWDGIVRPYSESDVRLIRGSFNEEHTYAKVTAEKFWKYLNQPEPIRALGTYTGQMAVQLVKAGVKKACYVSGWQIAGDAGVGHFGGGETYPDLGLYASSSVPNLVRRIKNAYQRAEQIDLLNDKRDTDWMVPIVADLEAGWGGPLNTFEITKATIEAGAAALHFENQSSISRRCGHTGSKTLVPTSQFVKTLVAARLAADAMQTETVIIGRIDSESAQYITSDVDETDRKFIKAGERTSEGLYKLCGDPMERCIAHGLKIAPYCDLIWMETSLPDLQQAEIFAKAIRAVYPGKMLAYNVSPSFHFKKFMNDVEIANFQQELGKLGYKFQFITLFGFHTLSYATFMHGKDYADNYLSGYVNLQQKEFEAQSLGYTAVKHQSEVGLSLFDKISSIIDKNTSTSAFAESTEASQF